MLTKGTRLGRFEIVGAIGAGGMGEVYRARDTRLGRHVAIKVLPAEVATDPGRVRRFEREARAAAALSHPNILGLYDIGEHDGAPYLVTELLEGGNLRDRISHGPLPVQEAVRIGVQVARGLAAAHAKGIVHRDLKPENLFLTSEETAKILDFGLASLRGGAGADEPSTESPTETGMTLAGTILGTVGYMAPEQVRGQQVDQRADIFAFGCVLYEMLTGRRAFSGDTPADTLGAILRDDPIAVEAGDAIAPALARLVTRCLEKRPQDRFSSAHDLALALAAVESDVAAGPASAAVAAAMPQRGEGPVSDAAAGLDPARVMVAAFENTTGDGGLDAVGQMVAEAVTHGLAELGQVEVVAAHQAAGSGNDAALLAAARAALAGVLVAGAIYRWGDRLELRGRITGAATGAPIYVLEPERAPLDQPDEAVDRIRQRTMSALLMHLGRASGLGGMTRPPLYSAYVEYLVGLGAAWVNWPVCIRHLERAAELDPGFWQPQIILLDLYKVVMGDEEKHEAMRRRLQDSQRAMDAATRLHKEEYEAVAEGRLLVALRKAQALLDLAPDDFLYVFRAAAIADGLNRPREALTSIGDIERFDWGYLRAWNQGALVLHMAATAHHLLGEHEAELQAARFGLRIYPDSLRLRDSLVRALAALGRTDEMERAIDEALQAGAEGAATPGSIILAAAKELRVHGHPTEAVRMAERGAAWYAARGGGGADPCAHLACLVLARRPEEARALARKLYEDRPGDLRATGSWGLIAAGDIPAVGSWGVIAARSGDREAAAAVARELAGGGPAAPLRAWYRAAIAAQLGDKEGAVELLRAALAGGQYYFELHTDVDFEPLKGYPPFEELIAPKG